jgi:predicted phage tail protein
MLRKIKLYGALAKFVGHRVLEADVATAAEAVRFLLTNWPELETHMAQQHYRVHTAGEDLTLEDIHNPMGRDIQIVPVMAGAGAIGRILLGIALIAVSAPKTDEDEGEPKKSFSFSGIQNTTRAGVPVPVVYGEMLVGGIVVSAGADIVQVSGV